MTDGIINIYKEADYTSHDVIARMRGILKTRKLGHTGTLDPDAVGVLPVCVGRATKACDMLTDRSKVYEAVLRLGVTTDTEDMSGTVLSEHPVDVTEEQIIEAVNHFKGDYDQIPPMYSAIKVEGRKLYELAREGIVIERKPRPVTIYELDILKIELPLIHLRISCSKGTYIRSLCRDIGERLGCGGAMEHLTRTRVGEFVIENAITLSQLEEIMREERVEE
jgi:tRNA pseudouridine55 synthase